MLMRCVGAVMVCCLLSVTAALSQHQSDVFETSAGLLTLHVLGHGSVMFEFQDKVLYVDPYSDTADFSTLPKADVILITHDHADHLDPNAIAAIRTPNTELAVSQACRGKIKGATVIRQYRTMNIGGFHVSTVPAYNLVHKRPNGQPYHPKESNHSGFIIQFGDTRVYIAGDTENIPEMKELQDIDIALLPMNLPYTMTPEMAAAAARSFRPAILYPYHFGDSDTGRLQELLQDEPGIEVRIRSFGRNRPGE